MKRIFTLTFLALASYIAPSNAQISLGLEAGLTYNTLTQYIKGDNRATENQFGYRGGFNVNIPFGELSRLHLQPGIFFDGNSGSKSVYTKQSSTGSGIPYYETDHRQYKVNQLNVPIYLVYKFGNPEFEHNHFFIGFGPSLSYTIGGRFNQRYINALNGSERVTEYDIPLRIGSGNNKDFGRFNIGASAMLGYEFQNGLYFKGHYTFNFVNMHPQAGSFDKMHSTQAGVTLGFFFKKFQEYKY